MPNRNSDRDRSNNNRLEEELKLWKWLGDKLLGEAFNATEIVDFEDLKRTVKKALFDDTENLVAKTGQDTPPSPPYQSRNSRAGAKSH